MFGIFLFDPVVPFAGPVVFGGVHHIPAVFPIVRVRVIFRIERIEVDFAECTGPPPGRLQGHHKGWDIGIESVAIGE